MFITTCELASVAYPTLRQSNDDRRNSGGNAIAGYDGTKVYTIGQTPASVAASMTSGWELDS